MKTKRANPLSPLSSAHAAKVEKWLGAEKIQHLQDCMANGGNRWYGRPICLVDVPGSLWITRDGDFVGYVNDSKFSNALDYFTARIKKYWGITGTPDYALNVGFASISDALLRASSGYSQRRNFNKSGASGVAAASSTLWRLGSQPIAGSAGAAAPGGTANSSSTTGALVFYNPASGTNHLVGADVGASVVGNSLMLYDRLFSVAKTMASTATEAVTGVPTRYQSTTNTDADYIGDNFGFIEIGGTALAATAHNWTTCLYTNQDNASSTLPSVTGLSGGIVDRLDQPTSTWFAPLASGDIGIKAWTQMQCSASVATGAINFCIGHPIGILSFPVINSILPFDWLTNRDQAPRIFDSACLAFLEILKPGTTSTTYTGRIVTTSAAA
jgi:hypothetical protein